MLRVVIAAFDGLQPSQITPAYMPSLSDHADSGVKFRHNHAVFPTVTRANSASLLTGVTPGKHGLTANKSIFHEYSNVEVVDALVPKLPEINRLTNGGLLLVPTLGELISEKSLKWVSVVGGTSGNAFVQHPNASDYGDVVIHPEFTNPPEHHAEILRRFSEWPLKQPPAAELVKRTAEIAIDYAIEILDPDVLLVWFPEPDTSQHAYGVDSTEAKNMYSLADSQFGKILSAIKQRGENPDIFIVSDHGYSTIDLVVDVEHEMKIAGFSSDKGDRSVVAAENGGCVLLYTPTRSEKLTDDLLGWLSAQEWVGAIATDLPHSTSMSHASLNDLGLEGSRAPDIVVTMRSTTTGQQAPLARSGAATGGKIGMGSHGGGSPDELHNTMIASGPSFISGLESTLPSGNIDVMPTILSILGIPLPDHLDGRVLAEALVDSDSAPEDAKSPKSSTESVTRTRVGDTTYLCKFG